MSQARDIEEPTMEEILSSIRRIIAADDPVEPEARDATREGKTVAATPAASPQPDVPTPPGRADASPKEDGTALADEEATELDGDDVLELTAVAGEPAAVAPTSSIVVGRTAWPKGGGFMPPSDASDTPPPAESKEAAPMSANAKPDGIVSDNAATAAMGAFGKLSQSLNPVSEIKALVTGDRRTVEDLVAEAVKPMLKSWLDQNLPAIVEKLVQQEISKMARRAEIV